MVRTASNSELVGPASPVGRGSRWHRERRPGCSQKQDSRVRRTWENKVEPRLGPKSPRGHGHHTLHRDDATANAKRALGEAADHDLPSRKRV